MSLPGKELGVTQDASLLWRLSLFTSIQKSQRTEKTNKENERKENKDACGVGTKDTIVMAFSVSLAYIQ